jgi:glutamine phosphoribosylpyrophosphate amidotransferase
MVDALVHRGPDSAGYFFDGEYSAGVRRLAINDVAHGDQPLYSADRQVVLVYNGEIYNYPELRRELETKGHTFRTHSDGEVICHLYEHHGEMLFERLDGMFAAALWIVPGCVHQHRPRFVSVRAHQWIVGGADGGGALLGGTAPIVVRDPETGPVDAALVAAGGAVVALGVAGAAAREG